MEKYIFCRQYNSEIAEKICKNFRSMFGVRLEAEKYHQDTDFQNNWEMLIQDVFRKQKRGASEDHIRRFAELVNALANSGMGDNIVRTDEDVLRRLQKLVCELRELISDMLIFPEDYYILESDIYMNAYLSIKFIETETIPDGEGKNILHMDKPGVLSTKGYDYKVPFKDLHKDKNFCLKYKKCLLGKDGVQIFGTSLGDDDREEEIGLQDVQDFCGYKKRIKISFSKDKKCERWSRKHILKLEQQLQMEDRILFYKTIDSILPRNMVDLMIMNQKKFKAYDYIYLVDWLCTCDSIKWKNIIGMITVFGRINQNALMAYGLWEELELCIDAWIGQIATINRRLKCLSNALIYMVYKNDGMRYIEDRCRKEIVETEGFPYKFNELYAETAIQHCSDIWEKQPEKLEVRIKDPLTDYWWIYAILQWRIIGNLESDRCKESVASECNLGWLIYRFFELHRFLNGGYVEDKILKKLDTDNRSLKKTKKITFKELIDGLGGMQGLMEICDTIFLLLPETNNKDENTDDFFQMLNDNEAEIRKLFCDVVRAKSGYVLEPEGSEIYRIIKYMDSVLRRVEDKNKFPRQ